MMVPVFMVAGVVNIFAKHLNYNINPTVNPHMDIRVKREANDIPTPIEFGEKEDLKNNNEEKEPSILEMLSREENDHPHSISKRQIRQQLNNQPYSSQGTYNNNGNAYGSNGNFYGSNSNGYGSNSNGYGSNSNGYGSNTNGYGNNGNAYTSNDNTNLNVRWKTKPNFFGRVFNAVSDTIHPIHTTTPPHRYPNNNGVYSPNNGNSNNDNTFYNGGYPNTTPYQVLPNNGFVATRNTNHDSSSPNKNNDNHKKVTAKKVIDKTCVFCFELDCAAGQERVNGSCVDKVNDDAFYD